MKLAIRNTPATTTYASQFVRDFFDTFEPTTVSLPFNVYEDKDQFVFETEVPGLSENDILVEFDKDTLKVSGEKKNEIKEDNEESTFYRREIAHGKFSRSFTLHTPVKNEEMKAHLKNGVLKITLPKAETMKAKQIPITTTV